MKNEIISELRRIRDTRAQRYHQDIEAMSRDLMKLDPWMEKKAFVMQRERMVPVSSTRRVKPRRPTARKARIAKHK